MVMTPQEYFDNLFLIQSENPPSLAILPSSEKIYNINLNKRIIDSPEFLSVAKDHKSETIYFITNRFFDYMDLSTTTCIIQYINADGEANIYPVPFFDIQTYANEDKILIPWCIDGKATKKDGIVEYSIRFYKIDANGKKFLYNLNTLPAKSKILYGFEVQELNSGEYDLAPTLYDDLLNRISQISKMDIYWMEASEI